MTKLKSKPIEKPLPTPEEATALQKCAVESIRLANHMENLETMALNLAAELRKSKDAMRVIAAAINHEDASVQ